MPIFRYTLKKILVSPSTWVIMLLTILILSLGWDLFAAGRTSYLAPNHWDTNTISRFLPTWKQMAFFGLIGLMMLIFIGVKAVQIFRDEIDDGTLLILVSKPISRNRIWAEKWLCFQTVIVGYVFFAILIADLTLMIPSVGDVYLFTGLLPYMGILFGVALLFDLIFTSIVLLISLVLNAKATIAIMVGVAALTNIFAFFIDSVIIPTPENYLYLSQAVGVYHIVAKDVDSKVLNWYKGSSVDVKVYQAKIDDFMKRVYQNNIPDTEYPRYYNPTEEQVIVKGIANQTITGYSDVDIALAQHILAISSVFRQFQEQSLEELMTGNRVGLSSVIANNDVSYSADEVLTQIGHPFKKEEVDTLNKTMSQKRYLRYFNIFYQLYYLFGGVINDNTSLFIQQDSYKQLDDPFILSFDNTGTDAYQVNTDNQVHKILNFPALLSVYVLIGFALLGSSWYVFNRKDFA